MNDITIQKKEQSGKGDDEQNLGRLEHKNTDEEVLNEISVLKNQGCKLEKEELRIEATLRLHARVINSCLSELESEVVCVGKECKRTVRDLKQIVTCLKGNADEMLSEIFEKRNIEKNVMKRKVVKMDEGILTWKQSLRFEEHVVECGLSKVPMCVMKFGRMCTKVECIFDHLVCVKEETDYLFVENDSGIVKEESIDEYWDKRIEEDWECYQERKQEEELYNLVCDSI
jgi:hypothetical protein